MVVDLKSCPRCVGDVSYNRDVYGLYKECLQCGWMYDIDRGLVIHGGRLLNKLSASNPEQRDAPRAPALDIGIQIIGIAGEMGQASLRDIESGLRQYGRKITELVYRLETHGYLSRTQVSKNRQKFVTTRDDGNKALEAYWSKITQFDEQHKGPNEDGSTPQIDTYELAKNGKPTVFGRYATAGYDIKSEVLHQFMENAYQIKDDASSEATLEETVAANS